MLHIRLPFIGIQTGWVPGKKILGAQLAPGEKMLSFVPGLNLNLRVYLVSLIEKEPNCISRLSLFLIFFNFATQYYIQVVLMLLIHNFNTHVDRM